MADISRDIIDKYNNLVHSCCDKAQKEAVEIISKYIETNKDASVADIREFSIYVITNVASKYGGASSYAAEMIKNQIFEALGIEIDETAQYYEYIPDIQAIENKIHYTAKYLVDDDTDGFLDAVSSYTYYLINRASNDRMMQTLKRDYNNGMKNIKYARVPSGTETCPFCIMLASRGFVYYSAKTAGADDHYHENCDCRIIPGYKGINSIDGYDPDALYRQYTSDLKNGKIKTATARKYVKGSSSGINKVSDISTAKNYIKGSGDIDDLTIRTANVINKSEDIGLSDDDVKSIIKLSEDLHLKFI